MAVTVAGSSARLTTGTTEYFLNSPNTLATYTFHVDTRNMAAGDVVELRAYAKLAGSTQSNVCYLARYADAQPTDDIVKVSVPITCGSTAANGLRFSLKQTKGTNRTWWWQVLKYA